MLRVTKPGGRLVVCEFSQPTYAPFRKVYGEYLMKALPKVAKAVSSNPDSYVYLAESIQAWPDQQALAVGDRRVRLVEGPVPQPVRRHRRAAPGASRADAVRCRSIRTVRSDLHALRGRSATSRTLATIKRDGRPQLSNVNYHFDPRPMLVRVSVVDGRAKVANLRRDPRASLLVNGSGGWTYAVLEGDAEFSEVARPTDDAAVEELIDVFRTVGRQGAPRLGRVPRGDGRGPAAGAADQGHPRATASRAMRSTAR